MENLKGFGEAAFATWEMILSKLAFQHVSQFTFMLLPMMTGISPMYGKKELQEGSFFHLWDDDFIDYNCHKPEPQVSCGAPIWGAGIYFRCVYL